MCWPLQIVMLFDSCRLRRHDPHNPQIGPTYARHLEFGRVQSLRTSPNLQLVAHHEKLVNRLH